VDLVILRLSPGGRAYWREVKDAVDIWRKKTSTLNGLADAASFLQALKAYIENPLRLLSA
jgi:hypothetical protein